LDLTSSQNISLYMPRFKNSADSPQPCHNGCFAWTSTALQASSVRIYFRSDTNTSGTRIPYGLYNSLSTLHIVCSSDCVLTLESISNLRLRATRKTRYGWSTKPYPTGTFTQQDAPSFACRTNAFVICVLVVVEFWGKVAKPPQNGAETKTSNGQTC
jgi:hypothetical protein